jgi:hypothetical protein
MLNGPIMTSQINWDIHSGINNGIGTSNSNCKFSISFMTCIKLINIPSYKNLRFKIIYISKRLHEKISSIFRNCSLILASHKKIKLTEYFRTGSLKFHNGSNWVQIYTDNI